MLNQSLGNVSRDSGVQVMAKHGNHSRNASNASSNYTTDDFEHREPWKLDRKTIIITIGLILFIGASISYIYFPLLLRRIIQSFINVKPDGEFYDFWLQSSEPTEVGIYFFHVENPWAVENGLEKLRVREMGKYMFKQKFIREIANFSDDKTMVNFTERRYFYFDPEKTTGSLDDNITVVNVPYAALSTLLAKAEDSVPLFSGFSILSHFSYRSVNLFLEKHNQHLFINTTVRELLYGYKLDILDTAESYSGMFERFGIDIMPRELFPNNSFGILNGRNGTPDGPYEMYTGLGGTADLFGHFKAWNGLTKLDIWKGDTCNMINGTDGTIWPAGVDKKDRLYFYIPDICRSLYVTFQEESQFKGIKTYIFSTPDSLLAGKRTNPDNACFCMEEDEDLAEKRCTLDGIFDASGCQKGIPLIISLPHFMGADKRITDNIEGLKPNATAHRPELHVEPIMGTVIHGDSRLQMSIRVPPNNYLRGFDKIQDDLYIPIFWGYKKLGMSDEVAVELNCRLFIPVKVIRYVLILLFLTGICTTLIGGIYAIIENKQRIFELLLQEEEPYVKSYSNAKYQAIDKERGMARVESETSDLGDANDNSYPNTPRSSTINLPELSALVQSTETDI